MKNVKSQTTQVDIKYLKQIFGSGGKNLWGCDSEAASPVWPPEVLLIRSATPFTIFMIPHQDFIGKSRPHNPVINV
jgi:hypothetical protein